MTPEERAFCEEIRADILNLIGVTGLIEQDAIAAKDTKQAWRANKASVALLAIADKAIKRMPEADVAAEQQELAAGGYDLAALKTAPPATIED